jgi:hypothetical protein
LRREHWAGSCREFPIDRLKTHGGLPIACLVAFIAQELADHGAQSDGHDRFVQQVVTAVARLTQAIRSCVAADQEGRNVRAVGAAQPVDQLETGSSRYRLSP